MHILYFALAAVSLGHALVLAAMLWLARRRLPRLPRPDANAHLPRISVIVPARDEAESIEAALRAKLAEGYPDLEVVVVDDRSSDGTGDVIDWVASGDRRIKVLHLDALPDGWLGKVHALERGVEQATGEWLLFCDADVHLQPGTLSRAIAHCQQRQLDFLAAIPEVWPTAFWLDVVLSHLLRLVLAVGAFSRKIEDPTSRAFAGIGAFNLFRRAALDQSPGLPWLKLEVIDDAGLGMMMKRAGARCGLVYAGRDVALQSYPNLGAFFRGTDRAGIAGIGRYSVPRLLGLSLLMAVIELGWVAALAGPPAAQVMALGTLGVHAASAVAIARYSRRPLLSALCFPGASLLMLVAGLRSAWVTLRRGGVVWRETVYPLPLLRAGARVRL